MNEKQKRERLMREVPPAKALASLAIPSMLAMIIAASYNFTNTYFIGKLGETNAIAAVSVVFPLFIIVSAVGQMIGVGSSSFTGRMLGAGKTDIASRAAGIAVILSIILSGLVTLMSLLFLERILIFIGASAEVLPYAKSYGGILVLGTTFSVLNVVFNNLLRAEGAATRSMTAIMLSAVMNIILDPIFIFQLNLGVFGAALATVVAQSITISYFAMYYIQKKSILELNRNSLFKRTEHDLEIVMEIFKIGLPAFAMQALTSISFGILNTTAAVYSAAAVAALGISNKVFTMNMQLISGFTQAFMPFVSFNSGAKDMGRVKKSTIIALCVTGVIGLFGTLLCQFFSVQIVGLFSGGAADVTELAANMLRAQTYLLISVAVIITMIVYFQATGQAANAAVLTIGRQGVFLIPIAIFLPKLFSKGAPTFLQGLVQYPMPAVLYGVAFAQPFADVISFTLCVFMTMRVFRGFKASRNHQ